MRVSLLLTVLCLLSLVAVSVYGLPDEATHVDTMEQHDLDLDIQQPTGVPTRTPSATPTRTIPRATPSRPRTARPPRTPSPTTRTPRIGRLMERLRMDPDTDMGMSRLTRFERRMLRRLFRTMFLQRMREMRDMLGVDYPMSRWEMRVIRMMALRDIMMAMDVKAQEAAESATMVEQQEAETYDDTTETEAESETEAEHETEAIPEDTPVEHDIDDPRLIDPTLIESEFDISAPYGGYGGYSYGGYGYGGYGSKKGYGGYKKAPYKKQPYKKVPYKKVPYKKVPYKKGYGGYGYGGY